ncbi:MAG: bZIP transcription factor [Christensenellaceae bacterium]|jgi:hypothetical protein|nr:bZIP transcription factor [Christensenellaceae bacterium]
MKKILIGAFVVAIILPCMFLFVGCGPSGDGNQSELESRIEALEQANEDLEQAYEALQNENTGMLKFFVLELEEMVSVQVAVGTEVVIFIDNSFSCTYFTQTGAATSYNLKIEYWVPSGGTSEFIDYGTVSGNDYYTMGDGVYRITVLSITGADSMQLNILLSETYPS